jgi:hypothetical protein
MARRYARVALLSFAAGVALMAGPLPASAAGGADPDWPCVQRLVPELAGAQMWGGQPTLDQLPADAALASSLNALPDQIASRDMPVEQASEKARQALEQVPEAERDTQSALLFRDTLARINEERAGLIRGIRNFARRQKQLADKVTAEGRQLVQLRKDPAQATTLEETTTSRQWDMRIFDERQRALRTLCDQPVMLEQRAFALARTMQGQQP